MKIKPCKCKKEKCIGFLHTIIERLERQDIGMEAEIEFQKKTLFEQFLESQDYSDEWTDVKEEGEEREDNKSKNDENTNTGIKQEQSIKNEQGEVDNHKKRLCLRVFDPDLQRQICRIPSFPYYHCESLFRELLERLGESKQDFHTNERLDVFNHFFIAFFKNITDSILSDSCLFLFFAYIHSINTFVSD